MKKCALDYQTLPIPSSSLYPRIPLSSRLTFFARKLYSSRKIYTALVKGYEGLVKGHEGLVKGYAGFKNNLRPLQPPIQTLQTIFMKGFPHFSKNPRPFKSSHLLCTKYHARQKFLPPSLKKSPHQRIAFIEHTIHKVFNSLHTNPRFTTTLLLLLLLAPSPFLITSVSASHQLWLDQQLSPDQRADALIAQMTLTEKIALMHGRGGPYVGNVSANPRLSIPALKLEDGPAGVADGLTHVTQFPAPIAAAATWDTNLMQQYGQNTASEQRQKGTNIQLAPTVNIARIPQWGRNFESLGEDPYLTSQMGVAAIRGIQSQGVIATVKHFAANNQEYHRDTVNTNIDERTLHEIYLPAFEAAVNQGQVGAVMCSYNLVNTVYACENPTLQNQILKQDWGFPGFVMSDWQATHSTVDSANSGLDLEMPDSTYYGDPLLAAVNAGQVSIDTINDHVHRILRTMFSLGLFDHPPTGSVNVNANSGSHNSFARQVAEQGTVLLKNSASLLPLDPRKLTSIAVIGTDASPSPQTSGGGSAQVTAPYVITPLQGITSLAAKQQITVTYDSGKKASQIAQHADVAIVFVSNNESEGNDLDSLNLPNHQDQLIQTVANANPHTIVVLNTGSPVLMPWLSSVQGVIEAWYPGQEDGNAIASLLFGKTNPSGRLPMTFPAQASDAPANTPEQYPGVNDQAAYSEGVFVGYRHYDSQNITPLFPFGYGLSYTSFAYSNLSLKHNTLKHTDTVSVSLNVTNTGHRTGAEVAQLYLGIPSTDNVAEPPAQLKAFKKILLTPGQTQHITFTLDTRSLSYWDTTIHDWNLQSGSYQVMVGSSSRDIHLHSTFTI